MHSVSIWNNQSFLLELSSSLRGGLIDYDEYCTDLCHVFSLNYLNLQVLIIHELKMNGGLCVSCHSTCLLSVAACLSLFPLELLLKMNFSDYMPACFPMRTNWKDVQLICFTQFIYTWEPYAAGQFIRPLTVLCLTWLCKCQCSLAYFQACRTMVLCWLHVIGQNAIWWLAAAGKTLPSNWEALDPASGKTAASHLFPWDASLSLSFSSFTAYYSKTIVTVFPSL